MAEKITISLSVFQRSLLLKYESDFADHELFRRIAVGVKKGKQYEISLDEDQLGNLSDQVCELSNNETSDRLKLKLDDLCDYLEDFHDRFAEEGYSDYSSNTGSVCILKVALASAEEIWRKIAIQEGQTLHDLHQVILKAFDRYQECMYSFFFPHSGKKLDPKSIYSSSDEYTHPYVCEDDGMSDRNPENASTVSIKTLHLIRGQVFYYLFDFGDERWHEITVEKTNVAADNGEYPRIVERRGESQRQYPDTDHEEDCQSTPQPKWKYKSNLHIGTCSWKYPDWTGLVYDANKTYSPNDYLPDYAEHFNTVEIDQWFWSLFPTGVKLPDPDTVKTYADSVPDEFLFSVKVPNAITLTHHYARQPLKHKEFANRPNEHFLSIDLLKRFLEILQPMGKKLGPVMFQFEYLNKQKMSSLGQFMNRLFEFFSSAPTGFDYAVEIRNANYLKKDYFECLKDAGLSPVLIEGYYMPPVVEVVEKFDVSAGKSLVIRLMGPDRAEIEKLSGKKWGRIIAPKEESLRSVARIVKEQIEQGREVVVNVNNHYEGCAVLTIGKLVERIW